MWKTTWGKSKPSSHIWEFFFSGGSVSITSFYCEGLVQLWVWWKLSYCEQQELLASVSQPPSLHCPLLLPPFTADKWSSVRLIIFCCCSLFAFSCQNMFFSFLWVCSSSCCGRWVSAVCPRRHFSRLNEVTTANEAEEGISRNTLSPRCCQTHFNQRSASLTITVASTCNTTRPCKSCDVRAHAHTDANTHTHCAI